MLDPNHARNELKGILNQREYQAYYSHSWGWLSSWWEKALNWITNLLAKWFPSIQSSSTVSVPILITFMAATLILLVVLIYLAARHIRRNQIIRDQKPLNSIQEINWSFQKHLMEAGKLENSNQYNLATRHLFLALLLCFHEKGWLEARIWKTNWEYYDELRKINPQAADQFFELASFFDNVTYGEHSVVIEEYIQFRAGVMKWIDDMEKLHSPVEKRGQENT